jgi:hypothetical protein
MDSNNKGSVKRKRSKSPNGQSITVLKRVDDLWFDDGSIVLQAESTQFRVHRSVLSTHSEIFRDMLAASQPVEEVEGCPVVRLPDSAEDWTHVLRALYDAR